MKRLLLFVSVAATLALTTLLTGACKATGTPLPNADANVQLTAFSNLGSLTGNKYFRFVIGDSVYQNAGDLGLTAVVGHSGTLSGSSYASLINNTSSSVTLNPSPTITVKAYGNTQYSTASASSSVSLGSVTASDNCSGNASSYSKPATLTITVIDLPVGAIVEITGSFTCSANGG